MIDVKYIKTLFPLLVTNKELIYLDNSATTLKPQVVIDSIVNYYTNLGTNIYRGVYQKGYQTTQLFNESRESVASFINALSEEIIFTSGTTDSINYLANLYQDEITAFDEIIVSELDHHSALLPWMNLANKKKAKLVYIPLTNDGRITATNFQSVLSSKTKIVVLTHISNVLGYIIPLLEIIKIARRQKLIIILDAAQSIVTKEIDVKEMDVDFLAFSVHKAFGPTGVGVLYGKKALLAKLEPSKYGGQMIDNVFKDHFTLKETPYKFEAGTPNISGVIGTKEAILFIKQLGIANIHAHTENLRSYTVNRLLSIKEVIVYNEGSFAPIVTFNVVGVHPHDVASVLDEMGIAVRAGHHCAQLASKFLNTDSTVRASFSIYNDFRDCDMLVEGIKKTIEIFKENQ